MHSRSAAQHVHFQPGIVCQHNFARNISTVALRLLARVGLEGWAVFDHGWKGSKIGDRVDLDFERGCCSGEIAKLTWIRRSDENAAHGVRVVPDSWEYGCRKTSNLIAGVRLRVIAALPRFFP